MSVKLCKAQIMMHSLFGNAYRADLGDTCRVLPSNTKECHFCSIWNCRLPTTASTVALGREERGGAYHAAPSCMRSSSKCACLSSASIKYNKLGILVLYAPVFPPQSDQVPSIFVSLESQLVVSMKPCRLGSSGKDLAHAVRSSGATGHHLVLSRNVAHARIYGRGGYNSRSSTGGKAY